MTQVIIKRLNELLAKAKKGKTKKVPTKYNRFLFVSDECLGLSRSIL